MDPKTYGSQITTSDPKDPITCLCVFVVNAGHYTITEIHAQFSPEGSSLVGYGDRVHLSSWAKLPHEIIHRIGLSAPGELRFRDYLRSHRQARRVCLPQAQPGRAVRLGPGRLYAGQDCVRSGHSPPRWRCRVTPWERHESKSQLGLAGFSSAASGGS